MEKDNRMNFSCAYTDQDGLTVSLAVSGVEFFLSPEVAASGLHASASYPAETFESCLPGITSRLLSAHKAIGQDLCEAWADTLKRVIDEEEKGIAITNPYEE